MVTFGVGLYPKYYLIYMLFRTSFGTRSVRILFSSILVFVSVTTYKAGIFGRYIYFWKIVPHGLALLPNRVRKVAPIISYSVLKNIGISIFLRYHL